MLRDDGTFRCWGSAANFCTGWGGALPEDIGDNETPASVGDVPAGFGARDLDLGEHSCAVSNTGEVRCWGNDDAGQLGLGTSAAPAKSAQESVPATVGVEAEAVAVGERHTCAVTASATIRCWGFNSHGQLGYGHTQNIGDDKSPASAGDVSIGGAAVQVVTGGAGLGGAHTCALLKEGEVRCWGWTVADFGYKGSGILGYGNDENVGDNELPSSVGPVALGGKVARLAAGGRHTCALRVDGVVICWGLNQFGALGLGHTEDIGDDETPNPAGIVSLPSAVIDLTASWYGTCVVLTGGELRCWGSGAGGTHGYGHTMDLGDDELPVNLGPVMVGGPRPYRSPQVALMCAHFSRTRRYGAGATTDRARSGMATPSTSGTTNRRPPREMFPMSPEFLGGDELIPSSWYGAVWRVALIIDRTAYAAELPR